MLDKELDSLLEDIQDSLLKPLPLRISKGAVHMVTLGIMVAAAIVAALPTGGASLLATSSALTTFAALGGSSAIAVTALQRKFIKNYYATYYYKQMLKRLITLIEDNQLTFRDTFEMEEHISNFVKTKKPENLSNALVDQNLESESVVEICNRLVAVRYIHELKEQLKCRVFLGFIGESQGKISSISSLFGFNPNYCSTIPWFYADNLVHI